MKLVSLLAIGILSCCGALAADSESIFDENIFEQTREWEFRNGRNLVGFTTNEVYYQSFNWDVLSQDRSNFYNSVLDELPNLMSAGINGIWFPPPSQTADDQGYMPGMWYTIPGGATLQYVARNVSQSGVKVIMDIVINHRSAQYVDGCSHQYSVFKQPDWGNDKVVKHDGLCDGGYTVPDNCGPGNYDTGENACYCPDIDHTNGQVQSDIINWLNWLQQNYSVDSYRFDFVKGYNGYYVNKYISSTGPKFSVGECWDGNTGVVDNWIQSASYSSTAFDFPNRYYLQDAINGNNYGGLQQGVNPAGVMGVYPGLACPFLDNHDTSRDDRFCGGNADKITQGYAYILTHPGIPFVYHDDWYMSSVQQAIRTIIAIRKNYQLSSTMDIYIDRHEGGLYAAYLGPGATYVGGGTVAMKLGTNSWSPSGSGWSLKTSGNNYAIWAK